MMKFFSRRQTKRPARIETKKKRRKAGIEAGKRGRVGSYKEESEERRGLLPPSVAAPPRLLMSLKKTITTTTTITITTYVTMF